MIMDDSRGISSNPEARPRLQLEDQPSDTVEPLNAISSRESSPDSLFDEIVSEPVVIASRSTPPITGLWVFPDLLPAEAAENALKAIGEQNVFAGRDQVMLFTRPPPDPSSLPNYLLELHDIIASLLKPLLPSEDFDTAIKQSLARQAILNLYSPGEGISPHIDLPSRYADGIIGVSLTGGCTMTFDQEGTERRYDVFIPARTVYVMCGEARWEWSHGIEGRVEDVVRVDGDRLETRLRSTRVSVTFRWMQIGADVLA